MYFAIVGKTPLLSLAELAVVQPSCLETNKGVVLFDIAQENVPLLTTLAWVIKRGVVHSLEEIHPLIQGKALIGASTTTLGSRAKKQAQVKRFKLVTAENTDLEVKQAGCELLDLWNDRIGRVEGWQDIQRFETIDFGKPVRGMQVGMMPAKLTQMLVNIGVAQVIAQEASKKKPMDITVYDPFVGFGTTVYIANSLWYHALGSDINITPAKQNEKRWESTPYVRTDRHLTLFKHDVTQAFTQPFVRHTDVVVTEGWLWPVVNKQVAHDTALVRANIQHIAQVYRGFLTNISLAIPHAPVVMTIPVYLFLERPLIEDEITKIVEETGYTIQSVGEIYQRKGQLVGRKALMLHRNA